MILKYILYSNEFMNGIEIYFNAAFLFSMINCQKPFFFNKVHNG